MNQFPIVGQWVTFYADPGSMALCLPVPGAKRFCGQIVATKPMAVVSGIPSVALRVRGRTGKEMSLDCVGHHVTIHADMAAAVTACEGPPLPPMAHEKWQFLCVDALGHVFRNQQGHTMALNYR